MTLGGLGGMGKAQSFARYLLLDELMCQDITCMLPARGLLPVNDAADGGRACMYVHMQFFSWQQPVSEQLDLLCSCSSISFCLPP
jgi:hypothetical protein